MQNREVINYDLSSIQDDVVRFNLETLAKCKQYTSKFRINPDGKHTCLEFKRVK